MERAGDGDHGRWVRDWAWAGAITSGLAPLVFGAIAFAVLAARAR